MRMRTHAVRTWKKGRGASSASLLHSPSKAFQGPKSFREFVLDSPHSLVTAGCCQRKSSSTTYLCLWSSLLVQLTDPAELSESPGGCGSGFSGSDQ